MTSESAEPADFTTGPRSAPADAMSAPCVEVSATGLADGQQVSAPSSGQEAPSPMLDVHPIHGAAHSWMDFGIHIATISVGLLIALAVEQAAEYVHHRQQLSEARLELAAELDDNRRALEMNIVQTQKIAADLNADMALSRARQSSHSPLGGKLVYQTSFRWRIDGTWQAVRQNGSLGLLPHDELHRYVYVHEVIASVMDAATVLASQMELTAAIAQ